MGFTKETAGRMALGLSYQAFDPETGEPQVDKEGKRVTNHCVFFVRRRNNAEANGAAATDASFVERLAEITVAPPLGFDDFPLTESEWRAQNSGKQPGKGQKFAPPDSPLRERMVAYFSDEQMYLFADHALALYVRRVVPAELSFRL